MKVKTRIRGFINKQKDRLNNRNNKVNEDEEILKQWALREKRNEIEERNLELRAEMEEELNPSKYCLHRLYDMIRAITFLSSLLLLIGQVVTLFLSTEQEVGPIQFILRIYVVLLCTLICFNELEFTKLIHDSALLRIWVTRGLIYVFVGILGLAENDIYKYHNSVNNNTPVDNNTTNTDNNTAGNSVAGRYVTVVAWLIVSCGILYMVMGVLCIQLIVNRLQVDYEKRLELAKHSRKVTEMTETHQKINSYDDEEDNDDDDDDNNDGIIDPNATTNDSAC